MAYGPPVAPDLERAISQLGLMTSSCLRKYLHRLQAADQVVEVDVGNATYQNFACLKIAAGREASLINFELRTE